ncbi:actin-like ATPase domain-containing protein [Didymella exigua CBS 183.55]|uniref:Actin-like ATPase domain-containing protein n=1 Tax=Didymella exigua CBS 183.55 TaxID=1150837 RepID=A0A6A5RUG3_9PLEO|nr:actin-like ATPase domain-containing protein [Didymella exigua CBS 183.55]KAF1931123.1 actin-like ATPase domain-containing protein [Didymella exigua CBS 183.55]
MSTSSERKVSASFERSVRGTTPRLADLASTPETPRTPPQRNTSSLYGSPSGNYRTEDEYVVLEIGSRFVRGGFPGESAPRCTLPFDPDRQRRVGDYRPYDPEYSQKRRRRRKGQAWGEDQELYRLDLTKVDVDLVGDKFERAIREAYTKYFLLDSKPRRITLALPPRLPHVLMSKFLDILFKSFHAPSITLMSNPVLSTVAAGLRSALVVDIGWAETLVTAVCEYREVHEKRSLRAGRWMSEEMATVLNAALDEDAAPGTPKADISFEETEEVMTRVGWCKPISRGNRRTVYFPAREAPVLEEWEDAVETPPPTVTIPFYKHTPPTELKVALASLAKPAESTFFEQEAPPDKFDDDELPITLLIYRTLMAVPFDVRRLCMSRILITGGVANMPGLKTRILQELDLLVHLRGWTPIRNWGSFPVLREDKLRAQQRESEARRQESLQKVSDSTAAAPPTPAGLQDPEIDNIDIKLANTSLKNGPPLECATGGTVRGVQTLGAWAGASLVTNQRIRGIVEIERERYLQHGLQGASRDKEVSVIPQRQSMGPGVARGAGERVSWTLGVWA